MLQSFEAHINNCAHCKSGEACETYNHLRTSYVEEKFGHILASGEVENGISVEVSRYDHGADAGYSYSLVVTANGRTTNGVFSPATILLLEKAINKLLHPKEYAQPHDLGCG